MGIFFSYRQIALLMTVLALVATLMLVGILAATDRLLQSRLERASVVPPFGKQPAAWSRLLSE
jgi:hypothetical protein